MDTRANFKPTPNISSPTLVLHYPIMLLVDCRPLISSCNSPCRDYSIRCTLYQYHLNSKKVILDGNKI